MEARMRRTLGATAIFLGWLCLPLSVLSGLVASQFMGLAHNEGPLPPTAVFGISGSVFIWLVVVGALLSSAPVFAAMFAADPSRPLYVAGVALIAVGAVLTLDDLGRAFGALLLPSGIFFVAGGLLMAGAADDTAAWDGPGAASPTPQLATEASRPAEQAPAPLVRNALPVESSTAGAAALTQASAGTAPEPHAESTCPWCSAKIPANATTCPECHATIDSELLADNVPVAGLTEIPPELRAYAARGGKRKRKSLWRALRNDSEEVTFVLGPSNENAYRPPSPEVRAEMARIDREIAGTVEGPDLSPDAPDVASPAETASSAEVPPPVHATGTDGAIELDQASAPDQASTADEAAAAALTPETPAIPKAPAWPRRTRRPKP
jgi:hypothetical protein